MKSHSEIFPEVTDTSEDLHRVFNISMKDIAPVEKKIVGQK